MGDDILSQKDEKKRSFLSGLFFRMLVLPVVTAVVGAVAGSYVGAWATNYFALKNAPTQTAEQTETLLGITRSAIELARATQSPPELIVKLEQVVSQSQALQVNLELLKSSSDKDAVSRRVDFWLPLGQGVVLGGKNSFSIHQRSSGSVFRTLNDDSRKPMYAGNRLKYETVSGKECFVVYIGPSPDNKLHGFQIHCDK